MQIEGPGISEPVPCSGSCTLALSEGTYFIRIHASGRSWFVPVVVRERQSVLVDVPSRDIRVLGTGFAIVGGGIVGAAGGFVLLTFVVCGMGLALQNLGAGCNLEPLEEELPYLLTATGVGIAIGSVGVGLLAATKNPSIDVVPARSAASGRALPGPSTFIGLAPVAGASGAELAFRMAF